MTSNAEIFEYHIELPDERLNGLTEGIVGFESRFRRLKLDLELLSDPGALSKWSAKHYRGRLAIESVLQDRYPLLIFEGDVGTGKTLVAQAACNELTRQMDREGHLYGLSTRVRGSGKVGEMSSQINTAFDIVADELGKSKLCFMIMDEGDSLAASREGAQIHHEDQVAVNTIIQKIDDIRRHGGRFLVILCTNRKGALDPAILRRAARIETFNRPNDSERFELLMHDLQGLRIPDTAINEVVRLTGPKSGDPGFTYSDLRTRLYPEALSYAYPSRPITGDDLVAAAQTIQPSPKFST